MPELPEVETTCRGIASHLIDQVVVAAPVHERRLRWPVPSLRALVGQSVKHVERRAKYILIGFGSGTLIVHLGMSGSLRIVASSSPRRPHDHVELKLANGNSLRLHDPRRFGSVLWTAGDPLRHPRLRDLGPEPLSDDFNGDYLLRASRGRRTPIKALLMDGRIVVGVGNIYASEALFLAGIHPRRAAGRVAAPRLARLVESTKAVLSAAITRGGTTLRDFVNESGEPGYFAQELLVYGRAGEPCRTCGRTLKTQLIGQRASAYCPQCQR